MKPISDPKLTCAEFRYLHSALIDASSIIYMHTVGFLELVMQNLELISLPEILNESGLDMPGIKCVKLPHTCNSNDEKLVCAAQKFQLPIISEDKKILKRAFKAELFYYNSLMMLNFLLFKEAIDNLKYDKFLNSLKIYARYADEIFEYGAAVYDTIIKTHQNDSNSSEPEPENWTGAIE